MTASITSFKTYKTAKAQNPEQTKKIREKMRENDKKYNIVLKHITASNPNPLPRY